MAVSDWSTTPASNDTQPGINWAEGQTAASVNNSARQMMADIATWYANINGLFEAGTAIVVAQASAPTGWTKDATTYDHALRLTSGDGGGTAGSVDFSTVFAITATDGHALTATENGEHSHPASQAAHNHTATQGTHTHGFSGFMQLGGSSGLVSGSGTGGGTSGVINAASAGTITIGSATPTITVATSGSGTPHSHDINLQVKYFDLIRCTKD